jgi:hypothetical protein
MKVACLFLTWNSSAHIRESIGRLVALFPREAVIVVDNGSEDNTAGLLEKSFPGITLLRLPVNAGFSGGNNWGIKAALNLGYEAVFLLNADIIVETDFISPCVQVLSDNPDIGVVGPTVLEPNATEIIQCEGGRIRRATLNFDYHNRGKRYVPRDELAEVDYVLGAAMLIRAELFRCIGGLDEDYNPAYVEEADFCYRARRAGFRCVISRGCYVRHIGPMSASNRQKAFDRISVRRFYFGIKHSGPLAFFWGAQLIVARVLYWKTRSHLRKWRK